KLMTKQLLECNYAQALEGDLDPSHVSFLHAPLDPRGQSGYQGTAGILSEQHLSEVALEQDVKARDRSPQISVLKTDYGLFVGSRRDAGGDRHYWRLTQLVLPFYVYVPGAVGSPVHCNVWLPMDDEHLVASDATLVQMRRLLLSAARAGARAPGLGIVPPIMSSPTVFHPKSLSWEELSKDYAHGKTPAPA